MPPRPAVAALLALLAAVPASAAAADGLPLTVLTERTGPAAAAGTSLANGLADYLAMLNRRDGGVGGLPLDVEECETGGEVARALACYENAVARGSLALVPGAADAALALVPRLAADRMPLVASGYGPAVMARGDVLPWTFAPPATVWDALSAAVTSLARDGGEGDPKGHPTGNANGSPSRRSLAYMHRDSPAGREPVPVLQALAAEAGLEFRAYALPAAAPDGSEAPAPDPWRTARAADPDYVILDATAGLPGTPLRDAAAAGLPLNRVVAVGWSGEDDLLRPAGGARDLTAKGLRLVTWHALGDSFPAFDQIDLLVVDAGLSRTPKEESAGPLYNRGVYAAVLLAEGIRNAQALANRARIDGTEMRRGLEAINLDPVRWKELGLVGFARRLRLSCTDHSGHRPVTVQEWTGARWVQVGDEVPPARGRLRPHLDAAVAAHAERATTETGSAGGAPREACPARP